MKEPSGPGNRGVEYVVYIRRVAGGCAVPRCVLWRSSVRIAIRSLSNDFQKVTFDPVPNRFSSPFVFRHDKPQISIQTS